MNGKYVDFADKMSLFEKFSIDRVPTLYRGPFSRDKVEEFVSGPTTLCPADRAGKFKGREGIVITPARERAVATSTHAFSRLILKAINFDYLERKGGDGIPLTRPPRTSVCGTQAGGP